MNSDELMECDWLITSNGKLLHYAEAFDADEWERLGLWKGKATCGAKGGFFIPGLFDRMSTDRCEACCRALTYPPGVGSPKNDERCRTQLELRLGRKLVTLASVLDQGGDT